MTDTVPMDRLQAVAALAPTETNGHKPAASTSSASANGKDYAHRLIVDKWLQARGVTFNAKSDGDRTIYIFDCPFDESHKGDANITQQANGALSAGCFHDSDSGKKWPDFREAIGAPDPDHWDPPRRESSRERTSPTIALTADDLRAQIERMASESPVFAPPAASSIQPAADRPRLAPGTLVRARDRNNYGTVVEDHGDTCTVHFVSPSGNTANVDLPKSQLVDQDGRAVAAEAKPPLEKFTAGKLMAEYPHLHPPVVDHLFRRGETINLISHSKAGKSWLAANLAFCNITKSMWLGRFPTVGGRVLIVDNELHRATIAGRLGMVARAMNIAPADFHDKIEVWSLRGNHRDIYTIGDDLAAVKPGEFAIVIFDAWYRMIPPGVSENDNAAVTALYNRLDEYADRLQAALVLIHHASKGQQSDKRVTDVGSGAGAQSRAADCHLILREHEQPGCVTLEAAVRSFPPVEPLALRWDFPLWTAADGLDPAALKRAPTRQDENQKLRDRDGFGEIVDALREHGRGSPKDLRKWTTIKGHDRIERLLSLMCKDGRLLMQHVIRRGNETEEYELCDHLKTSK